MEHQNRTPRAIGFIVDTNPIIIGILTAVSFTQTGFQT